MLKKIGEEGEPYYNLCSTNISWTQSCSAGRNKNHTLGVNPQQAKAKAHWFFLNNASEKQRREGAANIMKPYALAVKKERKSKVFLALINSVSHYA